MEELKNLLFIIASCLGSFASVIIVVDKIRTWFRPDPDADGMLLVEKKVKTKSGFVRFQYTKKEATIQVIKELNQTKKELNELRKKKLPIRERLRVIYTTLIVVFVALIVIFSIRRSKK